ncbi:hypothetical protein GCM10029964_054960 [Kibdelosporangium lantanae]
MTLAATVAFDHPTPAALAAHIDGQLGAEPPSGDHRGTPESVSDWFRQAVHSGHYRQAFDLLATVADVRPDFTGPEDLTELPQPVPLADGTGVRIVCLPSPMGMGAARQYARFANAFRGVHPVSAIPLPGFTNGSPVPGSRDAVVRVLAESVRRTVADEPFVLLGGSSGGLVAHAVAARLDRPPAAVVLLDTFRGGDGLHAVVGQMLTGVLSREALIGPFTSARLSGMGRYARLLADWPVDDLTTPVLFVRPTSTLGDGPAPDPWPGADVVDTPGDHFTMLEEHVDVTARTVLAWLASKEER